MATTVLKKNAKGYNYKYTELAEINAYIEEIGERYYQYVEPNENGEDYIMTVRVIDGKPSEPIRGCKIVNATLQGKSNPAQEYGSALTYARRYSLQMAYGLATTDDDAACFDGAKPAPKSKRKELQDELQKYADENGMKASEIIKEYGLSSKSTEEELESVINTLKGGK